MSDDNNVSTSKYYQFFPKQKLMQTNSLLFSHVHDNGIHVFKDERQRFCTF